MAQRVKNPPANAGGIGDAGLIPGSGRSPEGDSDNPLQSSCLQHPIDRGAWQATVHGGHKEMDMTEQLMLLFLVIFNYFFLEFVLAFQSYVSFFSTAKWTRPPYTYLPLLWVSFLFR